MILVNQTLKKRLQKLLVLKWNGMFDHQTSLIIEKLLYNRNRITYEELSRVVGSLLGDKEVGVWKEREVRLNKK